MPWTRRTTLDDGYDTPTKHEWYKRSDGCEVWYDDKTPWPNPLNENSRFWVAYGLDERYLCKDRRPTRFRRVSWMRVPRRWKTAEAAMKALDKEIPL